MILQCPESCEEGRIERIEYANFGHSWSGWGNGCPYWTPSPYCYNDVSSYLNGLYAGKTAAKYYPSIYNLGWGAGWWCWWSRWLDLVFTCKCKNPKSTAGANNTLKKETNLIRSNNDKFFMVNGDYIQSKNKEYQGVMQTDGNFVVYQVGKGTSWHTNTANKWWTHGPYTADMQEDGNFVVYDNHGWALWSSGT